MASWPTIFEVDPGVQRARRSARLRAMFPARCFYLVKPFAWREWLTGSGKA